MAEFDRPYDFLSVCHSIIF